MVSCQPNEDLTIIILAAGKGTRMKSSLPKVMHQIGGCSMLQLVINQANILQPLNIAVVISEELQPFCKKIIEDNPNSRLNFILQNERKGTAHAVNTAIKNLQANNISLGKKILILYGDTPLITATTINSLIANSLIAQQNSNLTSHNSVSVLAFRYRKNNNEVNRYGRIKAVENSSLIEKIIEFKDANLQELAIDLCNSGIMLIDSVVACQCLDLINNNNASGEFYLTDIVDIANKKNLKCNFVEVEQDSELLGANSQAELANLSQIQQQQLKRTLQDQGVIMLDPASVTLAFDTKIACGAIIEPFVVFKNGVEIAENVTIKSFSYLEGCKIGENSAVGPFARIRQKSILANKVQIGNFVEVKNSQIASGSKINHLAYVGDAVIGSEVNIGAGTVFCNYDGFNKWQTTVEDKVFIGSNSTIISPVIIGNNAIVGAGSVISGDVASNSLAIARCRQQNLVDKANKLREKLKNKLIKQ
jgi:bifunctional UDP-N-acetylglucosamine pyrophosphorylase/glucosamine-1-phosphate N-acetyltransferase